MPRKIAILLATAALAPAGLVAGCGDDSDSGGSGGGGVDIARAAQATSEKGTAKLSMQIKIAGAGLPGDTTLKATGVTALDEAKLSLDMDFAELVRAAGGPASGDLKARLLVDGPDVKLRLPQISGLNLPGGKSWVGIDLREAAKGLGIDASGLGDLVAVDPSKQLQLLEKAAGLKEVGTEEIAGAQTRRLKGRAKLADFVGALPEDRRDEAQKALDQLKKASGSSADPATDIEVWVDEDDVVRRMRQASKLPGGQGFPGGDFAVLYELSDFGTELQLDQPKAEDVFDATSLISQFAGQAGALGGGTTTTP